MFKNSIAIRLSFVVAACIALVLAIASSVLVSSVDKTVDKLSRSDLNHLVSSAHMAADAYNKELENGIHRLSKVFALAFPGSFRLSTNQTVKVGNQNSPAMLSGDTSLHNNFNSVDQFADATGGNATIFVRKDNDFIRLITSVKKEDGSRAVGTLLSRSSPAYKKTINGQNFTGKVTLFGREFITHYAPIKDLSGEVIGIRYIGIEFSASLNHLTENLLSQTVGQNGLIYIINDSQNQKRGSVQLSSSQKTQSPVGMTGFEAAVDEMMQKGSGELVYTLSNNKGFEEKYLAYYERVPELQWIITATIPLSEVQQAGNDLLLFSSISVILVILLLSAVIWVATRSMVGAPLNKAVRSLQQMAEGDYSQNVTVQRQDETGQLMTALQAMQAQMREVVKDIASTSSELATASNQLSGSSKLVANGSSQQSQSAASMASAIEELTVSIDRLSENAQEAERLSADSYQTAEDGAKVIESAGDEMQNISQTVKESSTTISDLGSLSDQISSIIMVIENIAEQTNLLALNAAIEAARAGEQGRGFAVVADEVRSLAARTTESAQEITATIGKMQTGSEDAVNKMSLGVEQVEHGATLANQAGESIQGIRSSAKQVMEVFKDISLMLKEQALSSNDVAKNVEHIASMSETNNNAVQDVAASAIELEKMAANLSAMTARFKT